jgi:hypothetical protein
MMVTRKPSQPQRKKGMMGECEWVLYKGLYHLECHSFLTTTACGELTYAEFDAPYDGLCTSCGNEIKISERGLNAKRHWRNKPRGGEGGEG